MTLIGVSRALLVMLELTRIVAGIQVFEAQRADGGYLSDVLTGFCPVEGPAADLDEAIEVASKNPGASFEIPKLMMSVP